MGFYDPNFGGLSEAADQANKPERAAPRLPLSLEGTFIGTWGNHSCIITNLSRTGALVAMNESLKIGSNGFLRAGPVDRFVSVTRQEKGLNAVAFEIPFTDFFVADLRRYNDGLTEHSRAELEETVRSWTEGENQGRW